MTKPRSETEKLKQQLKEKDKIIKDLKRQISRQGKREHLYHDLEEKQVEVEMEKEETEKAILRDEVCPKCKGLLELIPLGPKKLVACTNCKYRKTVR